MVEKTLNERQMEVLKWIAAGCPPGVMEGFSYKTTAVALQGRRLVEISKRRGSWSAAITNGGTYFLEHGSYPSGHWPTYEPATVSRRRTPARAHPERRVTAERPVEQLVTDVIAAGGQLSIPYEELPRYKSLVSSATRHGKVPEDKLLRIDSGTSWKEQLVRLVDKPAWMTVVLEPIPVPETLRKSHPAIQQLRSSEFPIRAAVRSRAYRLLHALAKEAERRGYDVHASDWRGGGRRDQGVLGIEIEGHEIRIDIDELDDRVPHLATATELREAEKYSWKKIPTHDQVPSGRLRIRVVNGFAIRQDAFSDTKTIDLADRLPHILQELELRAGDAEERRIERENREAERRMQWKRAMVQASIAAREDLRAKVLNDQIGRWQRANELDNYLTVMRERTSVMPSPAQAEASEWLDWVQSFRDRIDPLNQLLSMPTERDFTAAELVPFMPAGLSPYGP